MKFEEFTVFEKERIYDVYENIFNDDVPYEKISRKAMLKKILEYYKDPNNLIEHCSLKEIEYLYNVIHELKNPYPYVLGKYLANKLLLFGGLFEEVPIELYETIEEVYLRKDDAELIKRDKDLASVLGFLRVHALMPAKNLFFFGKLLLDSEDDADVDEILSSKQALWHVCYTEKNEKGVDEFSFYDYDDFYYDICEELYQDGVPTIKLLTVDEYQKYYYYGLDIDKECNQKFIDICKNNRSGSLLFEDIIFHGVLSHEVNSFDILLNNKGDKSKVESAVNEVLDAFPSAVLNGNTRVEYEKILEEKEKLIKKKRAEYEPQKNACIGNAEADIFYRLFFCVLDYLNEKYKIAPDISLNLKIRRDVIPESVYPIMQKLYEDPERYIDDFLFENGKLFNKPETKIINDFKTIRQEHGIIVAYKRDHTELLVEDCIYAFKGLRTNFDELLSIDKIPCMVQIGLLMYKGNIVFDGLFSVMPVKIGVNMLNHIYEDAKNSELCYTLHDRIEPDMDIDFPEDFSEYVIKKTKTDLLSSLKNLDKDFAKEEMEYNFYDDYQEWKEEVINRFEEVFNVTYNHPATRSFFEELLRNENTANICFPFMDVEGYNVFLYQDGAELKYYIPDEIKAIIISKFSEGKQYS